MLVRELMQSAAVSVDPADSVAHAARLLSRRNIGALPVCGADRCLRGVVTDRDIVLRCVAAELDPEETPVRAVMSRGPVAVSPEADVREACRLMAARQVRRLPVVEGRRLVGMLSFADLVRTKGYAMEVAHTLGELSSNVHRQD